jgi:hypothetical protein
MNLIPYDNTSCLFADDVRREKEKKYMESYVLVASLYPKLNM